MNSLPNEDYRELQACRICSGEFARTSLKLVDTPLANELYSSKAESLAAQTFPLEVVICELCKHVQLKHIVSPRRLFDNYVYRSGTSKFFNAHFTSLAKFISNKLSGGSGLVVEVGSNDGFLLGELKKENLRAVGIEPSDTLVRHSRGIGLEVKQGYLDNDIVESILNELGPTDVVVGNNVFAHIDDLVSAFQLVERLLKDEGLFIFEVADFAKLVETGIFDTIYHEHMSYHTVLGLMKLSELSGFRVIDVFEIAPHGGSLRIVLAKIQSSHTASSRVDSRIDYERENQLDSPAAFRKIDHDIKKRKLELQNLLLGLTNNQLIGYGAPAKLVTFAYQMDLKSDQIDYVIDDNELKQGSFIPGMGYEIIPTSRVNEILLEGMRIENLSILIFPWNLSGEIVDKMKTWCPPGTFMFRAFPTVTKERVS